MKSPRLVNTLIVAAFGMLITGCASADHGYARHKHHNSHARYEYDTYSNFGRVLDARPIYRQVAIDVPREYCHVQTVARESRGGDSFGGTVIGGLVGAAIGRELGHGRGSATAVGGLIGASVGNNAGSKRTVRYSDEEVCRTHYRTEYEQRIVGYDVRYSYQGRAYQTRTDRHPGDRIAVTFAGR